MARRRISVEKIKEVIRYGVTTDLSARAIGRALQVSRTAVAKYLEWFHGSGLTWEQAQELPDSKLVSVLEGHREPRTNARYERLAERFPTMVKELRRKGVTLQLLWEEYLRDHPDGYQNSQFCYHFHRWRQSAEVGMHIDHKAGEKLFVDYAGDRLAIVDREGGKEQPVETFVAILGASELTYVEASATQQSADWIRSNERALRYCGGCPQAIIPDNLRSAVSRSDPYQPGINPQFDAFAEHYRVVIMPARVRQAWSCPTFVDTLGVRRNEEATMPKTHRPYAPEFRQQMVELVQSGRTPEELALEYEPSAGAIRNWVAQQERDAGRREDGLSSDERQELRRLRRENKQLRIERDILKAAAWFARESDSIPERGSSS